MMISSIFKTEAARTAAIRGDQEFENQLLAYASGVVQNDITVTSDDGQTVGTITMDKQGREQYEGTPCLAFFGGRGDARTDGAAIITDTYANAKILAQHARDIYIVCGQPEKAIGTGLVQLEKHSGVIVMENCQDGGIMRDEQTIKKIAGKKVRVMLPALSYREQGSPSRCSVSRTLAEEIGKAAPARNAMLGTLRGVKLSDRYDTEKIQTPFGGLNRCLYGGLPRGQITLFASKAGNGKSTVILQIVGGAIEQGHRAAIYSGEMTPADIAGVMTRQIAGPDHVITREVYGRACPAVPGDVAEDIIENVLAPAITTISDGYGSRTPWTDWQTAVTDAIIQDGVDVVVVDNLMTLATLIMQERRCSVFEAQGIASAWLEHTAISYDIYILLVAHLRKGLIQDGSDKNDAVSGASDIVNAAGVVIFYEREKEHKTTKQPLKGAKKNAEDDDELPFGEPSEDTAEREGQQTAAADTYRVMYLTKNRLFGDVYYDGWQMNYDRISQRTYPAGNLSGYKYKSRWQKEREKALYDIRAQRAAGEEAAKKAAKDNRRVVITWDMDMLRLTGLADRMAQHLDAIADEIRTDVPAGPNKVIYRAGDFTQEAPVTVDADAFLRVWGRGKCPVMKADGVDITIE